MALTTSYTLNGYGNWSLSAAPGDAATADDVLEVQIPDGATIEHAVLYTTTHFIDNIETSGQSRVRIDPQIDISFDRVAEDGLAQQEFSTPLERNINTETTPIDGNMYSLGGYDEYSNNDLNYMRLEGFAVDVTDYVATSIDNTEAKLENGNYAFVAHKGEFGPVVDAYALTVVYSHPDEDYHSITLIDGHADYQTDYGEFHDHVSYLEDDFTIEFPEEFDGLDNTETLLSLGIGWVSSSADRFTAVSVNQKLLTASAGSNDDGANAKGGLITLGGLGDSTDIPVDHDYSYSVQWAYPENKYVQNISGDWDNFNNDDEL